MLERHIDRYGEPPRQAAADGGYASRANLNQAKAWGVRDMAFHKKCGLKIEDMVKSRWVYRKLRNFRAGIEAGISCLKRAFGLSPLHLARARPLQDLCLVLGGGLQSRPLRPPQADLTPAALCKKRRGRRKPGGHPCATSGPVAPLLCALDGSSRQTKQDGQKYFTPTSIATVNTSKVAVYGRTLARL